MAESSLVRESGLESLREKLAGWRRAGDRIGLVPTMGNLHAGHLSLVRSLRKRADRVVASIFVNPEQFGPDEDFERYPRTLDSDLKALEQVGCDLAWLPDQATMYPHGPESRVPIGAPADLAGVLCGTSRPGHFDGVVTVVLRLFGQVQPEVAIFGEKDFQQLTIIRRMVSDLSLPIEIQGAPIEREADGLAMSSRNAYLDTDARKAAPELFRIISSVARTLERDPKRVRESCAEGIRRLESAGFRTDYLEVRRSGDLGPVHGSEADLRVFAAAWLGDTRLIDNIAV